MPSVNIVVVRRMLETIRLKPITMDPTGDPAKSRAAAWIVSALATLLAFFPGLRGWGIHAGWVLVGDLFYQWMPGVSIVGAYFSEGLFQGLDLSVAGGSTPIFLRPNMPIYHPLIILVTFALKLSTVQRMIFAVASIQAFSALLSCYFCIRLCTRYLRMDVFAAAFVAVGYTFSIQMVRALWFFPLSIIACTFPMALYLALGSAERPSIRNIIFSSLPIVALLLGGYVPLGITAVVLAACGVFFWFMALRTDLGSRRDRFFLALRGTLPMALGSAVVLPYYIAILLNLDGVQDPSNLDSISYSAHSMAERPFTLLRALSDFLYYPGPIFEFTLHWGLMGVTIAALFIASLDRRRSGATFSQTLLKGCCAAYLFFALAIFGDYSSLSDVIFYFIPVIGYMHIYQRHLVMAQFFLVIAFLLMLENAILAERRTAAKTLFAFSSMALLVVAHVVLYEKQPWRNPFFNDYFVFEVLLVTVFLFTVVAFDRKWVLVMATIFMSGLALNRMYDFSSSRSLSYDAAVEKQLVLQRGMPAALVDFMTRNSGKEITKYHTITPGLNVYIPLNFPWYLGRHSKVSNYHSYDMHVSTALAYRNRMHATNVPGSPEWNHRPDWEWMRQTGADFIMYRPDNPQNDPRLKEFLDLSDPEKVLTLPDGTVVAPLKFPPLPGRRVAFDNGYVRLRSDSPGAGARSFETNEATMFRTVVESSGPAALEYEFWPARNLSATVNGKPAQFRINIAGLPYVELAPGRSTVEFVYRNLWLTAFGAVYLVYALTVLGFGMQVAVEMVRSSLRGRSRQHQSVAESAGSI